MGVKGHLKLLSERSVRVDSTRVKLDTGGENEKGKIEELPPSPLFDGKGGTAYPIGHRKFLLRRGGANRKEKPFPSWREVLMSSLPASCFGHFQKSCSFLTLRSYQFPSRVNG